jgi:hypothetical protein
MPSRFDLVAPFAQAGGVDQGQLDAVHPHRLAQQVAGGAGDVGDDGALAAGQRVQQRALAGVGRSGDHRMQAVAQARPRLGRASSASRSHGPRPVASAARAPPRVCRWVRRRNRSRPRHAPAAPAARRPAPPHAARTRRRARAARRARRASDAAIRSATASAWARSSVPLRNARSLNSPGRAARAPSSRSARPGAQHHRAAVGLQFDHVLAGVAGGAGKQGDAVVDDLARGIAEAA